ncbi:MAG: ABC transporter permease [Candidatus Nanopelagicales bacterium]|nr:ABC transporter permease [Candidatus Nanopelagicales bacterium]
MSTSTPASVPAPDGQDLRTLADEWGLTSSSARQPIRAYIRELWTRRDFIIAMGSGRKSAQYRDTSLGRLWQVLGPILNAIVYYFIFGVLLQTSRGVENYPAFLIIGVFTFTYTQRVVTGGTKAIANNRNIIRAIHFPRAVMPLSVIVQEVQQQLVSLGILAIIVLLTGEPITWLWLGVVPVVLMQTVFNVGLCMLVARWTAASRDVAQLVPFVMQTWRYLSGVMFSIPIFTADLEPWVETVLYLNPMTEYIELMRACLLQGYEIPVFLWAFAAGWALVTLVVGFVVFYRAEESYSRG